jgi:hypothetical protein
MLKLFSLLTKVFLVRIKSRNNLKRNPEKGEKTVEEFNFKKYVNNRHCRVPMVTTAGGCVLCSGTFAWDEIISGIWQ